MEKFSEWVKRRSKKPRRDACYHKVKSRYRVWPSAYACVPIKTTKALTKEGWKNQEELQIGDEILTFSLQKNVLEFKPILNLHRYKDAPTYVVQNGNTGFKFECTPNHKWVIKRQACKGKRGRKKLHHLINDMELVTIDEILHGSGSNRKLVISSNYLGGNPISMEKIYKYQTNWIEYLINCSPEQRESWLYSAIVYDGNQIKTQRLVKKLKECDREHEYLFDTPYGKQAFGFKQKDINHRDAFLLSAFLNQGIVTFKKHKNANIFNCHYIAYNGTKNLDNLILRADRTADVWCPETENGTWVMMQETDGNGIITITGNSGALSKCRKVGAKHWGTRRKKNENTGFMSFSEYLNETLGDPSQYDYADHALTALEEMQIDVETASFDQIKSSLINLELYPQHGDGWHTFITRIKSVAMETTTKNDFDPKPELYESTFKLEKERGLRGWFDRNKGKGWIDCKASKKGHLVPCGRKKAGKGADRAYPACRPTLGACNSSKHKKKSSDAISWKKKK